MNEQTFNYNLLNVLDMRERERERDVQQVTGWLTVSSVIRLLTLMKDVQLATLLSKIFLSHFEYYMKTCKVQGNCRSHQGCFSGCLF